MEGKIPDVQTCPRPLTLVSEHLCNQWFRYGSYCSTVIFISGNMHFHTVATQDLLAPNNDYKAKEKWQFVSFVSHVTVSKAVELWWNVRIRAY